ncbi:hypothetical protein HanIR_Chr05g0234931 [Helianthus annuus]|nr:hypothetical protein HanIR_Chr05g0234931 [Helianthus annuus]
MTHKSYTLSIYTLLPFTLSSPFFLGQSIFWREKSPFFETG